MKIYTIIGGVNGCGKSSLTGSIKAERTDLGIIVDPDKITAELGVDRNMTRHARSPLVPSWCQVRGDRRMGLEISLRKRIRGCLCIAPGAPPSTGCFRPCGAFQCTGGKLYSCTAKRCTAPRRGLSARAGTPKERFCNTTHAGVSGHDNARGFYDAITRGRLTPQNLIKPKIQPGNATPPGRARH